MGVFADMQPSPDTMAKLNSMRLYLSATALADIVNNTGTHIKPWALTGSSQATLLIPWPNQEKLPDRCWIIWQHFLKKAFSPSTPSSH
eukprot:1959773-Ditylum_brightwellii.AAC.1